MTKEDTKSTLNLFCALIGIEPNYSDETLSLIHQLIQTHISIEKYADATEELKKDVEDFLKSIKKDESNDNN